jgi:hypothetical protein
MASKDKQTGLTAESLMKAQQQMIESGKLSAEQLKLAQEQLAKLEELVNAFKAETVATERNTEQANKEIERITQVKKDAGHASLASVRDEIKNLTKTIEGKEPKSGRAPLPQVWRQGDDRPVMSTGGTAPNENIGSKERIQRIGGVIPGARGTPQPKTGGGGNIISDKILTDIEKSRSPTYDKFMDLMVGKPNVGGETTGKATARVREGPSLKGATAQIINITARSVNVKGTITGSGGSTTQTPQALGPSKSGGRGSRAEPKPVAPAPAAAEESSGPGFLSTAASTALGYGSKVGGMLKSGASMAGRGILAGGRTLGQGAMAAGRGILSGAQTLGQGAMAAGRGIAGAGRTALQLGGRALATPVGATLAAGAAMYGVGRAVDYGAGKLGVGKDDKGQDLQADTKADDSNWNRMKWYQKAESGMARGIEKVGGFVAPNMAKQAEADRIKKETAGLDTIESNEAKNKMKSEAKGWSSWAGKAVKEDQATKFKKTSIFSSGQSGIPISDSAMFADVNKPKETGMTGIPVKDFGKKSAPKPVKAAPTPAPKPKAEPKSQAATKDKQEDKIMKLGKQTFEQAYGAAEQKGYQAYDKAMQAAARAMEKASGPGQGTSNDVRRSFLDTEMYEKYRGDMLTEMRAKRTAEATAKAPAAPSGPKVETASAENSDIKTAPPAPIVVPVPAGGSNTVNNTTNNIMPRGDVRPTESAMERYASKQSHFY